ncbi:MAG TPA: alkaline phosphatase family protein, partial [Gemmatimonadaceae bacterium]|nr:alkaline phosphatase family protein [Gemmatimonadaceae bacterium]
LYVAEADNNAVAVFSLPDNRLAGRIPTDWYPTALAVAGDSLLVLSAKGRPPAANPGGPTPLVGERDVTQYTLGQLTGTIAAIAPPRVGSDALDELSARVARVNFWNAKARESRARAQYPPFEHVIYIIKENRTYDQVLGDLAVGDGDTSLVLFPRSVTPNHHALAERFGVYDRFHVNAEVSADGHNWSMAAYATDYTVKTSQQNYSGRGRTYDYEGTNREDWDSTRMMARAPEDDAAEPGNGYLWNSAERAGITFRNYGEFVTPAMGAEDDVIKKVYVGLKPFLARNTSRAFPGYDLSIPDQRRADVFIQELRAFDARNELPRLIIMRLPNDHTEGAAAGRPTPRAHVADNDLALGRVIEALSKTRFWGRTVVFVLEDDAQDGPDHVDSHRSPLFVISPWAAGGLHHRWANTTDVLATIAEILGLGSLSQFDHYGEPLRDVWRSTPDTRPYTALVPAVPLDEKSPRNTGAARMSERLSLRYEDRGDDETFNRILWMAVKGENVPYPGAREASAPEWAKPAP